MQGKYKALSTVLSLQSQERIRQPNCYTDHKSYFFSFVKFILDAVVCNTGNDKISYKSDSK